MKRELILLLCWAEGSRGPWLCLVSTSAGRHRAETLSVLEDLCLPPVFIFFLSLDFFLLYFFLHCRKAAGREGGGEGQGILIFTFKRETLHTGTESFTALSFTPLSSHISKGARARRGVDLLPLAGRARELCHRPEEPSCHGMLMGDTDMEIPPGPFGHGRLPTSKSLPTRGNSRSS